jgi:hypothetical protein
MFPNCHPDQGTLLHSLWQVPFILLWFKERGSSRTDEFRLRLLRKSDMCHQGHQVSSWARYLALSPETPELSVSLPSTGTRTEGSFGKEAGTPRDVAVLMGRGKEEKSQPSQKPEALSSPGWEGTVHASQGGVLGTTTFCHRAATGRQVSEF